MFGKVYTAVNMDTGAYMAMKEVMMMTMMTMMTVVISRTNINNIG